jgi:ribosome-interacting GTPase 1
VRAGILKQFKYALVWGTSVKHRPQKVGKEHVLQDEDIVQARPRAHPPPAPC